MFLPLFLAALWPIAAFAGGKMFAPLLFVSGAVLGWRQMRDHPRPDVVMLGLFLGWVCLTSLWSPANTPWISGSLAKGSFAIEAGHIRFLLSALGVFLFVAYVGRLSGDKTVGLSRFFPLAILVQLVVLIVLALQRESLLVADSSQAFVPSPQSLGRNANLLAMAVPIAVGLWADRFSGRIAGALSTGLIVMSAWVLLAHDALAGLLGWGFALGIAGLIFALGRSGFRWVFGLVGGVVLGAPLLAKGFLLVSPPQAVNLPLSAEQRLMIWQSALEKIGAKPIFGHGIDAVNVWDETYATRPDLLSMLDPSLLNARLIPNHTHNMPLQIWAEAGLIGAALLALALILLGRALPAPSTLTPGTKIAIAGVTGGALAMFTVAYSAWDESFWASLAVLSCALIVLARQNTSGTASP